MDDSLPAYKTQIAKAVKRKDYVSINHRVTEFLASYFDLLFAINEKTHPREKRLISMCKKDCKILPQDFEENLLKLFKDMYAEYGENALIEDVAKIITNVKQIIKR